MELPNVSEAMTPDVIRCPENSTIELVANLMVNKNIRSVVVENKIGTSIGIVTGGDIVKSMAKELTPKTPVSEIIGNDLITVDSGEGILEASEIMNAKKIKRLVVMEKGDVVGILTINDVIKYYPKYLQEFSNTLNKLDSIIKKL